MGIKVVDDRNLIKKLETSVSTPQAHRQKQSRPAHPKFVTDIETLKKLEGEDGSVSGTVKSFFHAGMKNIDEYGASAAKLFGANDLQKHFNERKRKHEARITNKYADFIGGMMLDPINFTPAGLATKGTKLARVSKSMAGGAVAGASTMAAKNYGDNRMGKREKGDEIKQGAGFVSILNGAIAALTKGKVKNAITSPEHIHTPQAKAAMDALIKNPEAFGLKKSEAQKVHAEYEATLKAMEGRYSRLPEPQATDRQPQHSTNWNYGRAEHPPILADTEIKSVMLNVISGLLEQQKRNQLPLKNVIYGKWDKSGMLPHPQYPVEANSVKPLYDAPVHPATNEVATIPKGGERLRVEAENAIDEPNAYPEMKHYDDIMNNPLTQWAMELARTRKATDMRYANKRLGKRLVQPVNDGRGWENRIIKEIDVPNHDYDFMLSQKDVKAVENGKMTPEIEEKLRHDIGLLENHPDYRDEAKEIIEGAETLFSGGDSLTGNFFTNGGINLATGVGAGTVNSVNTLLEGGSEEDAADSFIKGLLAGAVGVEGLRLLRKTNPKAYEKVQSFIGEHFNPDGTAKDPGAMRAFMSKAEKKEKRGIYNVTFNDKKSTGIRNEDLNSVIKYERGNDNFGAAHIQKHLDDGSVGEVSKEELLQIGDIIRNGEMNRSGAKTVYSVTKEDGTSLKVVVGRRKGGKRIITFYSDRNLGEGGRSRVPITSTSSDRKAGFDNDSQNYIYNRPADGKTIPQNDGGVKLGMFAGSKAKGWGKAKAANEIFDGKYDGMERFEIDDSKATLNSNALPKEVGEFVNIKDMLKHDELYRNYPEIGDIVVGIDTSFKRGDAEFAPYANQGKGAIFISKEGADKNVLLHELQHKIQEIENFARGGNIEEQLAKMDGEINNLKYEIDTERDPFRKEQLKKELADLEEAYGDTYKTALDRYQKMAGEIEARDVEARMGYTPQERQTIAPYSSENIPVEEAEVLFRGDPRKLAGYEGDVVFHRREGKQMDGELLHIRSLVDKTFNKEWTDISKGLKNDFKRLFSNTLSGEYLLKRDATLAGKNKIAQKAETLHEALKQLPEGDRKMLHEYIVGDIKDAPPEIKQIANNVRTTVKELTDELVERGILPKEAVKEWGQFYLKRQYEKYFFKEMAKEFSKKFTIDKLHERGKIETVSKKQYQDMLANGEITEELLNKPLREGGVRVEELPNGKIRVKRDWTKAERERMGEVTDAAITVPETLIYMGQLVEHSKFLDEISKINGAVLKPGEAAKYSEEALKDAGYIKLGKNPKYGVLSDQWVRADVADDVNAINDNVFDTFFGSDNAVAKSWKWYLRNWKKAKTVWNAPTHFNNLTSNFFLMHLAGLGPVEIGKYFAKSVSMLRNGAKMRALEQKAVIGSATPQEMQELAQLKSSLTHFIEAEDAGLLNQSQLQDILQGYKKGYGERGTLGKVDDWVSNLYQTEDGVNKLAMFSFLREKGWSVNDARHAVESIMPDYNAPMPKGWRFLRDTGVSPFISWSYYTFPKILHMVTSKHGAINTATALGAMYGYSYYATGIANPWSDDLPDDFKASRLPIGKDGDAIHTLKVDRINPYLQFLHPYNYFQETFSGVTTQLPFTMRGLQMYNGRPITYDNKPKAQQVYDVAKHIVQNYTPIPQELNNLWGLAESMVRDKRNRKTSNEVLPRTTGQELLKVLGLNTLSYDKAQVRRNRDKKNARR
ncbi:hypothetical protein [Hydrogenimonas sp.]